VGAQAVRRCTGFRVELRGSSLGTVAEVVLAADGAPETLMVSVMPGKPRLPVAVSDVVEVRTRERLVEVQIAEAEPEHRSRELIEEIAQALDDSRSGGGGW
jgi:hypothetical protein